MSERETDLSPEEAEEAVREYLHGAETEPARTETNGHINGSPPPPEPDFSGVEGEDDEDPEEIAEKQEKPRQIDQLVNLVTKQALLFHAPGRTKYDFYADIARGSVRETHCIGSDSFNRWMLRLYKDRYSKALGQSVLDGASGMLRAVAETGPRADVGIRTAKQGGRYYIDLCDDSWRAVEVSAEGWRVIDKPPARFKREAAMSALCVPERGGSIEMLRPFLNVKDDDSWVMVVAWLLMALCPVGPYPLLVINGEQGSAKSTMTKILRSLVDPSTAPLQNLSRDERELFITASNSWVLAFDNCSSLSNWLSDALCKVAVGGGFRCRTLYTDQREAVFSATRPIILNGITDFVEKGDLTERSVFIQLAPIPRTERRTEREVFGDLDSVRPLILGALLDAMVIGLQRLPSIKLNEMSRMAEFEVWATACEPAYTAEPGILSEVYSRNAAVAVAGVIDADPVALAVRAFAHELGHKGQGPWEGTATELLKKLNAITDEDTRKDRSWPKSAKTLGHAIAKLGPALRQAGIPVQRAKRSNARRTITIGGVKWASDGEFDD